MINMSNPSPENKRNWLEKLPSISVLGPILALLLSIGFFATQHPNFLTPNNGALIISQVMVVAVLAIGQTLIILTGGIDLSCGMVMALSTMIMTKMAADFGLPAPISLLLGLLVSTGFGFLNGLLVTTLKLPPFIVTLGTLNIAFAITQIYTQAQTFTVNDEASILLWFKQDITLGSITIGYGTGILLTLFLFTAISWALSNTAPGRHLYAVGNNPEAARLTGIPTQRVLLGVYTLAGLVYGIAGWLSVSRYGIGNPNAGQTENLDTITAVVLGGTSLFGGRGLLIGTIVGALISGVFRSGLTLMGARSEVQILITGILVIVAVAVDQLSKGKNSR
jgi:fructose transport system permease protein